MKNYVQQPGGTVPTPAPHTQSKTKVLKLILCPVVPQPSMYSRPGETPHFTIPKLHSTAS